MLAKPKKTPKYALGKKCSKCHTDRWYFVKRMTKDCAQMECTQCGNGNLVVIPGVASVFAKGEQVGGEPKTERGLIVPKKYAHEHREAANGSSK